MDEFLDHNAFYEEAMSFYKSAQIVQDSEYRINYDETDLFGPIVYLYRHAAELLFKALIDGVQKEIAYHVENIRFVQYLSRCGILQGLFFELFEIPEAHITKMKEIHKDKSIHPVIIETDLIYPSNHLFLFRYYCNHKAAYLLAKRMTIKFSHDEGSSTTLYGYCYPTNEYSLLKID